MVTCGLETNHSCGAMGLMSLKPPSPLLTDCQENPAAEPLPKVVAAEEPFRAMEPLSWVPPSNVLASDGLWANQTNCIIEPMVPLRLSYWIHGSVLVPQNWVRVSKPFSVRYTPPSLPK